MIKRLQIILLAGCTRLYFLRIKKWSIVVSILLLVSLSSCSTVRTYTGLLKYKFRTAPNNSVNHVVLHKGITYFSLGTKGLGYMNASKGTINYILPEPPTRSINTFSIYKDILVTLDSTESGTITAYSIDTNGKLQLLVSPKILGFKNLSYFSNIAIRKNKIVLAHGRDAKLSYFSIDSSKNKETVKKRFSLLGTSSDLDFRGIPSVYFNLLDDFVVAVVHSSLKEYSISLFIYQDQEIKEISNILLKECNFPFNGYRSANFPIIPIVFQDSILVSCQNKLYEIQKTLLQSSFEVDFISEFNFEIIDIAAYGDLFVLLGNTPSSIIKVIRKEKKRFSTQSIISKGIEGAVSVAVDQNNIVLGTLNKNRPVFIKNTFSR